MAEIIIFSLFVDLIIPQFYRFVQLVEIILLPMPFLNAMEHMKKNARIGLCVSLKYISIGSPP